MKKFAVIFCLLLAACQTPEEIEAARQAQMKADYDTCVNDYGFRPNSDGVRNCMLQLRLAREQRYYQNTYYPHTHFHGGYVHH